MRGREREWVWGSRGNQPWTVIASNGTRIVTPTPQLAPLSAGASAQQNYAADAELVLQAAMSNTKPRTQLLSIKVLISV